jgi:predicted peptidase
MLQQTHLFEKELHIVKQIHMGYLLFLPQSYGENPGERWPLLMFLHGLGERGDDLELLKIHGLPKLVEGRPNFPFIVVSPQCSDLSYWPQEVPALNALLDAVVAGYAVDETRVYLTGLSMGGFGTWALATAYPERFAAIVPICGGGKRAAAGRLKDVPVWAFHGAQDETVPLRRSQEMVDAINAAGGNAKLTVYPEAGHDSWTKTYANPELYEWFLQHTRP